MFEFIFADNIAFLLIASIDFGIFFKDNLLILIVAFGQFINSGVMSYPKVGLVLAKIIGIAFAFYLYNKLNSYVPYGGYSYRNSESSLIRDFAKEHHIAVALIFTTTIAQVILIIKLIYDFFQNIK